MLGKGDQMKLSRFATMVYGAVVICLLFAFEYASADSIPPQDVEVKTEVYPPAVDSLPVGTYDYDVSWQGIPVAVAKVNVRRYKISDKEYYYAEAAVRTARTISWAYKLRHISESLFEAKTFRPLSFYSHDIERRKQRYRKITYKDDGQVHSEYWRNDELKEEYEFDPKNSMFDPISAAFMARSVELELGKEVSVDVFNAKERYLITFKVAALEKIQSNGVYRDAYKVVPTVKKLMNPNSKRRLESATLWIAADDSRDVLKLQSKVWIGSINSTFEGYTPGNPEAEPLTPLQVKLHRDKRNKHLYR
jgi:hypothetical protein